MEQKSIGMFITTLRKANGMTQKDLAEKLNVSDKTISRWERDDGAPDLSAIPVLAEIFGVTCDEILRGARKPEAERGRENGGATGQKTEKQIQRLLAMSLNRHRNDSLIAAGISGAGLLAAAICNIGLLRAYIGFFSGMVFFLASAVWQMISLNNARFRVSNQVVPEELIGRYQFNIFRQAKASALITCIMLAFTIPLIVFPYDPHIGLNAASWLKSGTAFGAVGGCLCLAITHVVLGYLLRKDRIFLGVQEQPIVRERHRYKTRFSLILALLILVTGLAHNAANIRWSPWNLAEGASFSDYRSFRAYMAQDIAYDSGSFSTAVSGDDLPRGEIRIPDGTPEGKLVCRYVHRNQEVLGVKAADSEDGLPVMAITHMDYHAALAKNRWIHIIFVGIYIAEGMILGILYHKKRPGGKGKSIDK